MIQKTEYGKKSFCDGLKETMQLTMVSKLNNAMGDPNNDANNRVDTGRFVMLGSREYIDNNNDLVFALILSLISR